MTLNDYLRKTSRFLDDHWVLKWFVVPVLFMASILFVIGTFMVRTTPVETLQLVGLFAGFSLAIVAAGLVLDRIVRAITGGSIFTANRDLDE